MPKAAAKRKATEPSNRSRAAKIKERNDHDMRDDDEDGLFVSQSPPSQQRTFRRTAAFRPLKMQASVSRLDERDTYGSIELAKHEKSQTRRAMTGKRQSKPSEEFGKAISAHIKDREREIKDILSRCMVTEETFSNSLHDTFASIMGDGHTTSRTHHISHVLADVARRTLAKAHAIPQESDDKTRELCCTDSTAALTHTRDNWATDFKHTETVLEVGRMVGEDKINMKLSGQVPVVQDTDYHDASNVFFARTEEDGAERETWASAAKSQGKIVKRMTAAIAKE